jgi:hypothetical protein
MKIIMTLAGKDYESKHDYWESLDHFHEAAANGAVDEDEFGTEPDYSIGQKCTYRMENE